MTKRDWRQIGLGLFFISPWIIGFFAFTIYPMLASIYFSFTDFNILNYSPNWVGLDNYVEMFTLDRYFPLSLSVTFRYAAMLIILGNMVAIPIAMLLNAKVRGLSVYRTFLFLPVMTPAVAAALTWVWILNPKHGLINGALAAIGIQGPYWLASPDTALFSLVLVAIWYSGMAILIYLAGLQDVPAHLLEAAEIDGAGFLQRTWHITLPLLTPQILFNVITGVILALQEFSAPFIMTNGGPNNATLMYGLYLYRRAFLDLRMGYASAMAWLLFIMILGLTLLMLRLSRGRVAYNR
jgi:multiple sugar transport system permease protein